jgi:transmembrane sensor
MINDAASAWLAQREGGFNAAQASEFARWRDADPRHAAAVRRAEFAQQLLARLPETRNAAALLAEVDALCSARPRVVPFSTLWKVAAGLAAAACVAVFFWTARPLYESANATYTTAAGHHQSINLPDGSTLVLNSGSKAEVAFEPAERRVRLQHGEAHFYVAKDAARPFLVSAGAVTVRAVGTAFSVRRQAQGVEVVVTEGKVKVSRQNLPTGVDADPDPIFLVAGERALIDSVPSALAAGEPAPSAAALDRNARHAPRLMFNDTPLSDVVVRFNQYSRLQIEIADADLAQRSVGGNFDADNAESFIHLLSAAGDVRVERVSETRVVLHKAP